MCEAELYAGKLRAANPRFLNRSFDCLLAEDFKKKEHAWLELRPRKEKDRKTQLPLPPSVTMAPTEEPKAASPAKTQESAPAATSPAAPALTVATDAKPAAEKPTTRSPAKRQAKTAAANAAVAAKKKAAAAPAPKAKKPAAKKAAPVVAGEAGPSYFDLIVEAITELKERNGSSRQAIAKIVESKKANYQGHFLNKALRNAVDAEKLVQIKGSYKLSPALKKPAAKKKVSVKVSAKSATTVKKVSKVTKKTSPKAVKAKKATTTKKVTKKAAPTKKAAKPAAKKTKAAKPAAKKVSPKSSKKVVKKTTKVAGKKK